jgi:hypothetical protein
MLERKNEVLSFESSNGCFQMTIAKWERTADYYGPGCWKAVAFSSRGGQFTLFYPGPNSPHRRRVWEIAYDDM